MIRTLLTTLLLASFASAHAFEPASSRDEVRDRITSLPSSDIWWTVEGEAMLWNFKNLHRIMPTVNVYRAGQVSPLEEAPDERIADYMVQTPDGDLRFDASLSSRYSSTMGIVITHRGRVVFERYPRQQPYEKPVHWSVTKALVGTLIGILEANGKIDTDTAIEQYIPTLGASSFKGITVRNILDMATGLDCPEEYEDKSSCYYQYSMTVGDGHWNEASPDNPYTFTAGVQVESYAPQGTSFSYSGINTFVLAWLVEEVTGMPFQDALSQYIWRNMGAEHDASIIAPRFGVAVSHGGLLATLRDVARFGILHTPSADVLSADTIVPQSYVHKLLNDGRPAALAQRRYQWPVPEDAKHNIYQWDFVFENDDIYKGGWGGQGLLVNPTHDWVVSYTGYFSENKEETINLLPIVREMLQTLYQKEDQKEEK